MRFNTIFWSFGCRLLFWATLYAQEKHRTQCNKPNNKKATLVDLSPLSHDTRSENETGLFYSSSRLSSPRGLWGFSRVAKSRRLITLIICSYRGFFRLHSFRVTSTVYCVIVVRLTSSKSLLFFDNFTTLLPETRRWSTPKLAHFFEKV